MKETIKYYFNVFPTNIYEIDNGYYFYINDVKYYFVKYQRNPEEIEFLVRISNELYNKKILVDTFIKNKDGSFFVNLNNDVYVLLRVNSIESDAYNIKDIIYFNDLLILNTKYNINTDWANLWMKKIDDYETEISEFNTEYPLVQESFNYYVGLAENAISYFKDTLLEENIDEVKINLNHKRVHSKAYSGFINNPLTFTFDYEMRDVSEYIKSKFFEGEEEVYDDIEYILMGNYSKASLRMFYSRLLYPSYYFDELEKLLTEETEEKNLLKYIDKIEEYEEFLRFVYKRINRKVSLPVVQWLFNKEEN